MYCLFCVVLCTVCVEMCTVLLPPGDNPIAVNKYINNNNNNNNNNPIPNYGTIRLARMISGFRRDAGEINALFWILGSVSWQLTFRHNLSVPFTKDQVVKEGFLDIMTLQDRADRLSQNVGHNHQHTLHTVPEDLRLMCNDTDDTHL